MQQILQDLRFGFRMFLRRPMLVVITVLSLGLGIGANTTIFSMVKAILLQPLPGIQDTDNLVLCLGRRASGSYSTISYPDYLDFRDRNEALSGLIAYEMVPVNLSTTGEAERVWGMIVSDNYFSVLGVQPQLGRGFTPEEGRVTGGHAVAVIGHRLWQRNFGSDPNIVDKTVTLNGYPFTVVGVAPANFSGTFVALSFDIWVPLAMQEQIKPGANLLNARESRWLESMARLKPGYSLEQARMSMSAIASQLQEVYPDSNKDRTVTLLPLSKAPWGPTKIFFPVLMILTVSVGLLLLIACANVGNLLLLQALGRWREIAIRLSIGASRARLVKQLLTEGFLLAALGGIAGLGLAFWSVHRLDSLIPQAGLPIQLNISIDGSVLLFTVAVSLISGMIFALVPALQTTHPDLVSALKDEALPASKGYSKSRLRSVLVVVQMALCQVLLISAVLFLMSLEKAQNIDTGFESKKLLLSSINLINKEYDAKRGPVFYRQLLERIEGLPGVRAASFAAFVPLGFTGGGAGVVSVDGYTPQEAEDMRVGSNQVGPKYFETMGIPLLTGRDFNLQDGDGATPVVIVNQTMARRFWPNQDAVGKTVRIGGVSSTVIGVARDSKYSSLGEDSKSYMYQSLLQVFRPTVALHVLTVGDPDSLIAAVRNEVRAADPTLALYDTKTMTQQLEIAVFPQRVASILLTIFGVIALILAVVGIYTITAHAVKQRTREIAIRLALGAQQSRMLGMIVKEGLVLSLIATAIGVVVTFVLTRVASELLFGISPADALTFIGVSAALILVSVAASYIPACRIMRISLLTALRTE